MSDPTTPKEWWMRYRRLMSPTCGPVQISETKRAFTAGMYAAIATVIDIDTDDEDKAVEVIRRFRDQLLELADEALMDGMQTNGTEN